MVKLFVGGFPLDMTELELVQLIALHGDVSTIKIVRDKKTRVCKGYAFVEMTDRKGAEQVIEMLDGTTLGDRKLSISIKEDEPAAVIKPANVNIRRYDAPIKNKRPRRQ
jgi:RNA recognition motif-containing protein